MSSSSSTPEYFKFVVAIVCALIVLRVGFSVFEQDAISDLVQSVHGQLKLRNLPKARVAVVLSGNATRFESTREILARTGAFSEIFVFKPVSFDSQKSKDEFHTFSKEKDCNVEASEMNLKVFSNFNSFIQIISKDWRLDPQIKWMYVFEDDLALSSHFQLNGNVPPELLAAEANAQALKTGFLYAGVCLVDPPRGCNAIRTPAFGVDSVRQCYGRCAHALAFEVKHVKTTLANILSRVPKLTEERMYFDAYLDAYSQSFGGVPTAGSTYCSSPEGHPPSYTDGHCGVFIQDRQRYPTSIG